LLHDFVEKEERASKTLLESKKTAAFLEEELSSKIRACKMAQASAEKIEVSAGSLCFMARYKSGEKTAEPTGESSSLLEPSVYIAIPSLMMGDANSLNL